MNQPSITAILASAVLGIASAAVAGHGLSIGSGLLTVAGIGLAIFFTGAGWAEVQVWRKWARHE